MRKIEVVMIGKEEVLKQVAKALLESLDDASEEHIEVFDNYTYVLRKKITHTKDFPTHFANGYAVLAAELKK